MTDAGSPRILVAQHDRDTPLGLLEAPLRAAGCALDVWHARREPAPELDGAAGLVVLGSEVHPTQDADHPWLTASRELTRDALAAELPVLGVCLGSQLLAQAAGGEAGPIGRLEIGWLPLDPVDGAGRDPLLSAVPPAGYRAFQWHEHGFTVPPGAGLLARTGEGDQAFRVDGRPAWGIQFHVEADPEIIGPWVAENDARLRAMGIDPEALMAESAERNAANTAVASAMAEGFAGVVRS